MPGSVAPDGRASSDSGTRCTSSLTLTRVASVPPLGDEVAHGKTVALAEREGRHRAVHRIELRAFGCLECRGRRRSPPRRGRPRRLMALSITPMWRERRVGAEEERGLAFDVARQRDVGVAAEADVDRFEIEAFAGRADWLRYVGCAVCTFSVFALLAMRRRSTTAASTAAADRSDCSRTSVRPICWNLSIIQLRVLGVGLGADDAAPELRMSVVTIAARHRGQLFHVLLQVIARRSTRTTDRMRRRAIRLQLSACAPVRWDAPGAPPRQEDSARGLTGWRLRRQQESQGRQCVISRRYLR